MINAKWAMKSPLQQKKLTNMIIGKTLIGQENLSYSVNGFFEKDNNTIVCAGCGNINSPYYFDRQIIPKKKLDFSSTYEGAVIVSKRFKDYCLGKGYNNLIFVPLEKSDDYFYFFVLGKQVEIDRDLSKITTKDICPFCGYYKEVFGGVKLYAKEQVRLSQGFFVSDVFWRTHYVFNQKMIVDLATASNLKEQGFKGLYFEDLYCEVS